MKNFSKLLKRLDNLSSSSSRKSEKYHNDKAAKIPSLKIEKLADNVTLAVEQKLWSEEDGSYIDIQLKEQHIGGPSRTLTQDVVLYLIVITEEEQEKEKEHGRQRRNKERQQYDTLARSNSSGYDNNNNSSHNRGLSTLAAIRTRAWKKNKWPLVTEVELERTGSLGS